MIYWAVQMKTTHQIPQMLVGKGFPTDRAKDPEGFMKATFPLTMGMGIILLAVGLTGALEVFGAYPIVDTILTLLPCGIYAEQLLQLLYVYQLHNLSSHTDP